MFNIARKHTSTSEHVILCHLIPVFKSGLSQEISIKLFTLSIPDTMDVHEFDDPFGKLTIGHKLTISPTTQNYDFGTKSTSARTFVLFPDFPAEIRLQIIRKLLLLTLC